MEPAVVPGSAVYGGGNVVGTRVILPYDNTTRVEIVLEKLSAEQSRKRSREERSVPSNGVLPGDRLPFEYSHILRSRAEVFQRLRNASPNISKTIAFVVQWSSLWSTACSCDPEDKE